MHSHIDDKDSLVPISPELKRQISSDLEQFHRVFDVFWDLSEIQFSPPSHKLKTACVAFPPGGKSYMIISRVFWDSLNADEKLFVILHECLHVMLDHGMRNAANIPGATHRLINVAQDITINEMIVDMFGFARGMMQDWRKYCWIETCFDDPASIERNQVFEYYLKKLIENPPPEGMEPLDEHGDDSGGHHPGDPDPLAQALGDYLTWDELQAMIKSMGKEDGRGIGLSPFQVILENRTPAKVDFNTLVKKLKRNAKSKEHREADSWAREPRRFGGSKMMLPGRIEVKPLKHKLITALFFDVSGSCMSYFNTFNSVREAFEKEEKLFDIRTFAFDTRVFEVEAGKKLSVGGGTSFNIIEEKCLEIEREDGRYPDCVVVITDGAGNRVAPRHPGRWVWLLTPGATRSYIDLRSAAWPIKNVTF